jgi:hypothetical protein
MKRRNADHTNTRVAKPRRSLAIAGVAAAMTAGSVSLASTAWASTAYSPVASDLAYLVRLERTAEPTSAARFRLTEEIDRLVWTTPSTPS